MNAEAQYLEIMKDVLHNGEAKDNRTTDLCYAIPPTTITHDMSLGFPLLTTKKMGIKTIARELQFFIGGLTDKQWLKDKKCNIWNEWCNPALIGNDLTEQERLDFMAETNDLGPVYGYQWRRFNRDYTNGKPITQPFPPAEAGDEMSMGDQLAYVINTLKTNPNDRRMHVSAWNPLAKSAQALPPCHLSFTVTHINGVVNLVWSQRSCDILLGVPFNLASYALLLELICKETGMVAGQLTGQLSDVHLYEQHLAQADIQTQRTPYELPKLKINNWTNIWEWDAEDIQILNYTSHDKLSARVSI